MRIIALIVLSFFGGWLWKYMDERMSFVEWCKSVVFDPVMVVMLSAISAFLLFLVYGLLRLVFVGA
jgi:hypothetical protein